MDIARDELVSRYNYEWHSYIKKHLAGDFADLVWNDLKLGDHMLKQAEETKDIAIANSNRKSKQLMDSIDKNKHLQESMHRLATQFNVCLYAMKLPKTHPNNGGTHPQRIKEWEALIKKGLENE